MSKTTPFLWFATDAEEAAKHYVSLFPNSAITGTTYYTEAIPDHAGQVMTVSFTLDGRDYVAFNGGPAPFGFTEAISLWIDCADQAEVDHYWDGLSEGGQESQCGWLKDRYGISWQVVPTALTTLLSDPDRGRAERATAAMLGMRKLIVADLEAAADAS